MNNKEDQSNLQVAVVPGSAWIQQRSKTYGDRIYYFNTETGKAVWNLSQAEIEKAQKVIHNTNGKTEMAFDGCPEPKQPPKELNCDHRKDFKQKPSLSKIYNKQIINNSFPGQPHPITAVIAPCSQGMSPSNLSIQGTSTTALSFLGSACNYNLYPVGQQIFITPTVFTQTSQSLANSNVRQDDMTEQKCPPQTFTEPRSQTSPRHFQNEKYIPKANKTIFDGRGQVQTEVENINMKFDLRQRLTSKRIRTQQDADEHEDVRSEGFSVTSYEDSHQDNTSNSGILPLNDIGDESGYSDADSDWLEDNICVDGNKLRLDVTRLKRLATRSNSDSDCWYIAVDKTILLRHLNFLNTLYNSDEQCHLMVPRAVLDELRAETQNKSMRRASRRARRAYAFVSQQSDSSIAIIEESEFGDSDIEIPHVLNCCFKLAEQYYHVVLISNDFELQRYNNRSVPIFSIKELKEYLAKKDQCEEEEENVETDLLTRAAKPSPDLEKVKIVISNNLIIKNPETTKPENVEKRNLSDIDFRSNKSQNKPQERHENKHLSTSLKSYMLDEQTVHNNKQYITSANHTGNGAKINNAQTSCTVTDTKARDSKLSRNMSKIRLKRRISNPPVACIAASVEKQQFKWRRRRVAQASESNSTRDPNQTSNKAYNVPTFTENAMTTETFKGDDSLKIQMENSETSTVSFVQNSLSEKLVAAEETSTSGVISNTASNVDSVRSSVDKETVNKNVMFEVTDHSMEEHLTMRCDEWISRYVQIMEEVLSQVLHQYPQFLPNLTPPPWTLHEATECIGIMFRDKRDVTDTVQKLLKVLENVCDDRKSGIHRNIRPSDYMQLYSYGVYLVEILQLVVKNCEDLRTAADSLLKLLYDIKNPNLDSSHNDSVRPDRGTSTVTHVPKGLIVQEAENNNQANTKDRTEVLEQNTESNLRSKKRKLEQEAEKPEQQDNTMITYIDTDFLNQDMSNDKQLSSLTVNSQSCSKDLSCTGDIKLDKNFKDCSKKDFAGTVESNCVRNFSVSPKIEKKMETRCSKNLSCTGRIEVNKNVEDWAKKASTGTVEPKIVNNFNICPEFVKKMEKTPMPLFIDEPQCTEYTEDSYDYIEDPNYTESDDYYDYQENPLQAGETRIEEAFENESYPEQANPEVYINTRSNSNFECFRQIMNKTKQAIMQVTVFCKNCGIDLTNRQSCIKKIEILDKAKQAYQCIDNVHKNLSSIMHREKFEPENNAHSVLRKAEDDMQIQKYGDIIEKYLTQTGSLLAVINIIIATVKS